MLMTKEGRRVNNINFGRDWDCPQCSNLVFGSKLSCQWIFPGGRVCGAKMPAMAGDWDCPSCGNVVFSGKVSCPRKFSGGSVCGAKKPAKEQGHKRKRESMGMLDRVSPSRENSERERPQGSQRGGPSAMPAHADNRVFLRLPEGVTDEALRSHFARFGEILDVYIPVHPVIGKSKGVAFVTFSSSEHAAAALEQAEQDINGEACEVVKAAPRPDRCGDGGPMLGDITFSAHTRPVSGHAPGSATKQQTPAERPGGLSRHLGC
jgi:uncharacterized Zn finger protein (UPF0148 family)